MTTTTTTTNGVSPSEDDLKDALKTLRSEHPTLGISKIHAALLADHPEWTVSEKRTRKILQSEGLVISSGTGPTSASGKNGFKYPSSKLMEGLDLGQWTKKVEVKFFDKKKGKGLVAKERISEGETIWKEDPFILAPEWDIYDLQIKSGSCMHCSTSLAGSSLVKRCADSLSSGSTLCPAHFCNHLCRERSNKTHPLLCPSQNPASTPLLSFAQQKEWMALHALAQCTARVLLAAQGDGKDFAKDWEVVKSLAQLGMEERHAQVSAAEPDRATWKKAFQLYEQAFREPTQASEKKKLARLLRKPIPQEVVDELFNYDAFLRNLGRMSLNLEAHGGLYVLHSHINHACSPNTSIRHFDTRTALSRITVVAKKDIEVNEELVITYVNPDPRRMDRQRQLDEWGFGQCRCARCEQEKKDEAKLLTNGERHTSAVAAAEPVGDDLEKELKASFGVF
ncbi:hypothetical protein BXZ70DRAFT_888652 [Cristinia sonorae]|uniref:Histone-lysine N-methyltransferase SET5 n=1 Tax=Cristinia sonorae TaxID=1940300 RepID=A0A8K0UWG3_9AGAR|nr:hypothetical protein BXZ70DRAFT_888652 [Cristinia sonorae]